MAVGRPDPQERHIAPNGANLCYFEWGQASAEAPTWLFCHATGFHARCWDKVIAGLPEGAHAIAVDMRGHGRSEKKPPFVWESFGGDVAGLVEALELRGVIGVGHSMGGHAMTQAAARLTDRFERLVLVDPVLFDPERLGQPNRHEGGSVEDHPVARRKGEFASWEAMHERFAERIPYVLWRPEIFTDYCKYGVLPAENGVTLACPPIVEASVYMGSTSYDFRPLLPQLTLPVTVLRARPPAEDDDSMDFTSSPTWPGLAAALPDGSDVYLPELSHFIAMQAPEIVIRCARQHVRSRQAIEGLLEDPKG